MDSYTPLDLAAQLRDGALVVIQWVGVSVAAALVLFFLFLAIRTALRFFNLIVGENSNGLGDNDMYAIESRRLDAEIAEDEARDAHYNLGLTMGLDPDEARAFADEHIRITEERVDAQIEWQERYDYMADRGVDPDFAEKYARGDAFATHDLNGTQIIYGGRN
jgi:hypothetical protein